MKRNSLCLLALISIISLYPQTLSAQMRKVYVDTNNDNEIYKISFFSPSQGYVAFRDWIGYTADSGRTFTKKFITLSNVNYNGYSVNLTFGFTINGVKAFDQNTIIAYGDYGLVPAILYSSDGGNNFKLVYHSQYDLLQLSGGIEDMVFPQNNSIGYAVDPDRILKTADQGLTWSVVRTDPQSYMDRLEAVDNNNIFAYSTGYSTNKMVKSTTAGVSWQQVILPAINTGKMSCTYFSTITNGWLNMHDDNGNAYLYKTINGGSSWNLQNDITATPFYCTKMKFTDDNTGYALSGQNAVFKTLNSGIAWEPLPRDNNFSYLNYTHNDLQVISATQLWAGGGAGLLELSTNAGGTPIPKAYFKIDTSGLASTGNVNLKNYSRTGYTYKWFLNNVQISTTYNTSYAHSVTRLKDTVKLVVTNGSLTDTLINYQFFNSAVTITSFTPTFTGNGKLVTITGTNFSGATSVTFGGVAAQFFSVSSSTKINATVGTGASGNVTVTTPLGQGSLAGFTFIPPPVVTSFTPTAAAAGTTVTITGNNFTTATSVAFANIAATSFTVVSPTVLTAIVPSGTSGFITVTTPGGIDSLTGFISLPTVTSFTPNSGTQGTVLNITGTSFTGATAVSVGNINVMSFTVNSSTSITALAGAGATGNVAVTKPGGSSSLASFTWFAPPVIATYSPASGPIGTTVMITGTGFSSPASNNIVTFGTMRATVLSGTATSLTVTVPSGATFDPITVTNDKSLTAYSQVPFIVTFTGGSIAANSFVARTVINTTQANGPMNICVGDLDNDGKQDLIISNAGTFVINSGVMIYRNTSTTSTVSFDTPLTMGHLDYKAAAVGDLDGDGKPDLAILNNGQIAIFKNTSVPGSISFTPGPVLTPGGAPSGICIGDIDGDGKADIIVSGSVTIYRNTTEGGIMAFASQITLPVLGGRNVILADLNGDGKPDLVIPNAVDNLFTVLQNNSSKANVSFGPALSFPGFTHAYVAAGDIDGDGKQDLVFGANDLSQIEVVRNTGTGGIISFAPAVGFPAASAPEGVALSDMDGDGKLDICGVLINYNLTALKNNSTPGNISFSPSQNYVPGSYLGEHMIALADINGDGKNDAVVTSESERTISIHLNIVSSQPFIQSFNPVSGSLGTVVTITGSNFTGATAVSFGGIPASSFVVNSPTTITAIVGTGVTGNVSVTTPNGISTLGVFNYLPLISDFSPTSGNAGTIVTIKGNGFTGTTNVSFGGAAASSFTIVSDTSLIAVTGSGSTGNISVTNAAGTGTLGTFNFLVSLPPVITSFTPASGSTGSTVVISGNNFNTDPSLNNVFFGTIKAQVISGTATSLSVTVPGGATYDHIRVTTNYLSAESDKYFFTSFAGGDPVFTPTSFNAKIDSVAGYNSSPANVLFADLNNDNKLDIVISGANGVSVFKNTSTNNGTISLAPRQDFASSIGTRKIALADFDGDGKQDISFTNYVTNKLVVMRNISSAGQIKFDTLVQFNTGTEPGSIAVGDINGDGKPDVVVTNYISNTVSVFINSTLGASISFAPRLDYATGMGPNDVKLEDIDGDHKRDIIVSDGAVSFGLPSVSVLRNVSNAGNISFAPKVDFNIGSGNYALIVGDADGDQKPDIITSSSYGVSIGRNTSTTGTISFAPKFDLPVTGGMSWGVGLNDLNGDGIPDISAGEYWFIDSVAVFANRSTPGNLSFSNIAAYATGKFPQGVTSGDLDGDGLPDLAIINHVQTYPLPGTISILKNTSGKNIMQVCSGTSTSLTSNVTGAPYQWQQNSGSGFINIADDTIFSGTNTQNLLISNTPISFNGSEFRCLSGGTISQTISLAVSSATSNASVSISASATSICSGSSVTFTAIEVNGGSSPSYQWQINGVNAGTNSNTFTSTSLQNNDQVKVLLTGSTTCGTAVTVTSNIITLSVSTMPIANAGRDTSICGGSAVIGVPATGSNIYSWSSSPAGFTSAIANPSVSPVVTTTYFLTVTNNICVSKDTVTVSASSLNTNAGVDKTICTGSSATIGTASVGTTIYNWSSSPAGFTSQAANPVVSPVLTTTYFLTTSNGICTGKDTVLVTVIAPPVANAGVDKTICNGNTVTIGSSAVAGSTYGWSPSTGLSSSLIAQPAAAPAQTINYILSVTNSAGCRSWDTVTVTVSPGFSISLPDTLKTICIGDAVTIGNSTQAGFSYQWTSVPAGFSSTLSDPSVSPSTSTVYYLTQTSAAGCQAFARVKVIADSCNKGGASLFPNPANGYIIIQLDVNNPEPKYFTLTDSRGSIVLAQQLNYRTSIDTRKLTPGLYYYSIKLASGSLMKSGQIIIVH